jgi:hypothetical protein
MTRSLFISYYLCDQIKEDMIGGTCSMNVCENKYKNLARKLDERRLGRRTTRRWEDNINVDLK